MMEESSSSTEEDPADSDTSSDEETKRPVHRVRSTRTRRYIGHGRKAYGKGRKKQRRSGYQVEVLK